MLDLEGAWARLLRLVGHRTVFGFAPWLAWERSSGRLVGEVGLARFHRGLGADFDAPLFIDNTNRYQAVAESEKGLAGDYRNFIIVDALPEGLGAGIVVNGRLLHGRQSIAGEIGHMTLDPNEGFPCVCGSKGCFEAMVSERRITALARELAVSYPNSVLSAKNDAIALDEFAKRADQPWVLEEFFGGIDAALTAWPSIEPSAPTAMREALSEHWQKTPCIRDRR